MAAQINVVRDFVSLWCAGSVSTLLGRGSFFERTLHCFRPRAFRYLACEYDGQQIERRADNQRLIEDCQYCNHQGGYGAHD